MCVCVCVCVCVCMCLGLDVQEYTKQIFKLKETSVTVLTEEHLSWYFNKMNKKRTFNAHRNKWQFIKQSIRQHVTVIWSNNEPSVNLESFHLYVLPNMLFISSWIWWNYKERWDSAKKRQDLAASGNRKCSSDACNICELGCGDYWVEEMEKQWPKRGPAHT